MLFTGRLDLAQQPWLAGHQVFDAVLFPATAMLELALVAGVYVGTPQVRELTLVAPFVLPERGAVGLQLHSWRTDRLPMVGAVMDRERCERLLKDADLPALLVFGDRSQWISAGNRARITEALPQVPAVTLPGGHDVHYEQAEALAAAVLEVLRGR